MSAARARRLRAFCVGLPKTGTTSVGALFENYRSRKLAGSELERLGCDYRAGACSRQAVRQFVARRDETERLEMDPASANWTILDVLTEQLPDAKFILTIRDCFSWCDSLLDVLLGHDPAEIGNHFIEDPGLFRRLFGCELRWFRDAQTARSHCGAILDGLLPLWAEQATTALRCPPSRTLIVRTGEISASVGRMADFAGVPVDALLPGRSHVRRTARRLGLLRELDRELLQSKFAAHAGSSLMREHFPGATLDGFLSGSLRTGASGAPGASDPGAASNAITSPRAYPVGYWLRRAEAAALAGDRAEAERGLAEATAQGLEPDEQGLADAVRARLEPAPGVQEDAPGPGAGARGHREMVAALAVIRALAPDLSRRSGYRLERLGVRERDASCHAVLAFAGARGGFVLELSLRDEEAPCWLASERFAISYRREAPAVLQGERELAEAVLEAVERGM